jgi:ribosomal protein S12 methylthiotransferase accessory factor
MKVDLDPQVERMLDFVSPRTGLITSLTRAPRSADEPSQAILYHAQLANFDFKKPEPNERATAGKGLTESEAIGGAIGEAIERYCAYHPAVGRILRTKRSQLDGPSVGPDEFVLYTAEQYARTNFPYAEWKDENELGWIRARELPSGKDVWVPACLVYLNYAGVDGEDSYCAPTSNGLAAGPDLDHAILGGLNELAERDGFLAFWMNRLAAPEVEIGGTFARSVRKHYQRFGVELRVFNLTTDLPAYVMMAVALGDGQRDPAVLVGLGAHLDPSIAMRKAIFEICQIRPGESRRYREENAGRNLKQYSDVRTLHDHSAYLMPPERLGEMAFLLENGKLQKLSELENRSNGDLKKDGQTAVEGLNRAGCRVAYVDITTADVQPYDIRVVRTLATQLQPMHFGYGEERLGGRRLFQLPRVLGYTNQDTTERDLNPCPHPLA